MNINEILITGYDGDSEVFATNLTPESAKTIFIKKDADGQLAVDSVPEVVTPAFGPLIQSLEELGVLRRSSFRRQAA